MNRFALHICIIFAFLVAFSQAVFAQTPELVPPEYRVKIDAVDMSNAPDIRIRATFLDKSSRPVEPDEITAINIYADGDLVTANPKKVALGSKSSKIPIDLALVIPISQRFTDNDLDIIRSSLDNVIGHVRPEDADTKVKIKDKFPGDRVAGLFDDGRAINIAPLGKAGNVADLLKATKPQGQPSFLYSSLEKAIDMMSISAGERRNARRAIILVTDAFDSYSYRKDDVQRQINDMYQLAKEAGVSIFVVMYKPYISSLIPLFEGLSRKTGGTYRYASVANQISTGINTAWGEIFGELVIDFRHPGLRIGQEVTYQIEVATPASGLVKSDKFKPYVVQDLKFNWKLFFIVLGIIVAIIIVTVIVLVILHKRKKRKEAEEAEREEQIIQEKIERGEVCPKCRRTMLPEWKECMFCAREAAEEITRQKAENRQKALEEAEKKGIKLEGRICPKCNRTMMPQWKECLFCKAGIGTDAPAPKGIGPRAQNKKKDEPAAGRICPVCKRPMRPHWTTCLYCEADAANRPAVAPAPAKQQQPAAQAQRICPTCGRPMKAHWDICLYCEANRSRQ